MLKMRYWDQSLWVVVVERRQQFALNANMHVLQGSIPWIFEKASNYK